MTCENSVEKAGREVSARIEKAKAELDTQVDEQTAKLLEKSLDVMKSEWAALVGQVARVALSQELTNLVNRAEETTMRLQEATAGSLRQFTKLGWTNSIKTAAMVTLTTVAALTIDHLLQGRFP